MKISKAYILICISVIVLFISSCSTSNLSVGTVRVKNKPVAENNNKQPEPLASTDNSFIPIQPQTKTDTSFSSAGNHITALKPANLSAITYYQSKKERLGKFIPEEIINKNKNYTNSSNSGTRENKYQYIAIFGIILGVFGITALICGFLFESDALLIIGFILPIIALTLGLIAVAHHKHSGLVGVIIGGLILLVVIVATIVSQIIYRNGN